MKIFQLVLFVLINGFACTSIDAETTSHGGTPRIQFTTNFFDFGKITVVRSISGVFKFKNVGDGILKVDAPLPGCECTESKVNPGTVAPGETGEIIYTIRLDHAEHNAQKYIRVHSNDPKTPNVELTMQFDYTPLYEVSPITLWMTVPAGKAEAKGSFTLNRTDGKPLQIDRITSSEKWISATLDPSFNSEGNSTRVNVIVHRSSKSPSAINARIDVWDKKETTPVQTVSVVGEIQGELAANPAQLYWVLPDLGKNLADYSEQSLTKHVELKSVLGNSVEIKNATSNIKGMSVQVVTKEANKKFDLILKLNELPKEFAQGKVTIETSLASLSKIEVPVTIAVASDK